MSHLINADYCFLNVENTETIRRTHFVTTECEIEINSGCLCNIRCMGCSMYGCSLTLFRDMIPSLDPVNEESDIVTNQTNIDDMNSGRCIHTTLMDDVWRVLAGVHDPNNRFDSFLFSEINSNNQFNVTALQIYGDTVKWLVVLSEEDADVAGAEQNAVCRTTSRGNTISVYCYSMKCVRGKNKRFNIGQTRGLELCVHLQEVMTSQKCCDIIGCKAIEGEYFIYLFFEKRS